MILRGPSWSGAQVRSHTPGESRSKEGIHPFGHLQKGTTCAVEECQTHAIYVLGRPGRRRSLFRRDGECVVNNKRLQVELSALRQSLFTVDGNRTCVRSTPVEETVLTGSTQLRKLLTVSRSQ